MLHNRKIYMYLYNSTLTVALFIYDVGIKIYKYTTFLTTLNESTNLTIYIHVLCEI